MKINTIVLLLAIILLSASFAPHAEARARYGSARVGGYTSQGKGSHYIGGYVRHTPINYKSFR